MPAVQETVDQVRRIDVDQYKYGFETQIESDKAPKGLSEDTVRFISAKKNEPEWMLAWRLDAYQPLADHARAEMGQGRIWPDRLSGHLLLFRAEEGAPKSLDEIDPEILETYEKLGIPLREREALLGIQKPANEDGEEATGRRRQLWPRRGRCGVRFRLGRDDVQGRARQGRRDVHADLGSDARASRAGEEISRHGGAGHRQFLRHAQFGGVLRRLVRLCAAGRALPDGAVDLFPHQREAIPASSSAR